MDAHPLADSLPMLALEDYEQLKESIRKHGLIDPVVVSGGVIVDGRNRAKACEELGVEMDVVPYDEKVPIADYIWAKNVARRHLTDDQKAAAVMRWEEYEKEKSKERSLGNLKHVGADIDPVKSPGRGDTRDLLAERAGVTQNKIRQAMLIKRHDQGLLEKVERGEVTLSEAVKQVPPPKRKTASPEDRIKQIRALHAEGLNTKQAAERLGISTGRVNALARQAGVALHGKPAIQRVDEIRELASQGYRSEQIAEQLGAGAEYVRKIAKDNDIPLPDAKLKSRSIDVNRIVGETALAANALTAGLGMVESRVEDLDREKLPEWIEVLDEAIRELSGLRRILRKRRLDFERNK